MCVAAQRQPATGPGSAHSAYHLAHEALGGALGVRRALSKWHVQGLADLGTGGEQRVVTARTWV
jgi:hypothetical protein